MNSNLFVYYFICGGLLSSGKHLVRWCWQTEFTSYKGCKLCIPVKLTSPSCAKRWRLLTEMYYNVMVALRGFRAVKFDSWDCLLSSVHIVLVNLLRSVRF